jgi:hypothetical protein
MRDSFFFQNIYKCHPKYFNIKPKLFTNAPTHDENEISEETKMTIQLYERLKKVMKNPENWDFSVTGEDEITFVEFKDNLNTHGELKTYTED